MNELQQVLLVFAVIVIAVLYFLSKKRQIKSKDQATEQQPNQVTEQTINLDEAEAITEKHEQESIIDALNEQHEALSPQTEARLHLQEPGVPENQARLPFGDEFEMETTAQQTAEAEAEQTSTGPKHHVLEVEDLYTLDEVGVAPEVDSKVNFGIPKEQEGISPGISQGEKTEPQIFALLVLSTGGSGQEFSMDTVNQALLGVGLSFTESQIYVTTDNKGNEIIRVANILEPGTFPAENLHNYTTPGLALILELPTTKRAPAAMHDLIMMARKLSQRLNGRLYNMERHLIKESDLQAMRDAAVEYESEPL
ncbi:cell division protein ZipA C-terminal FtsZ-binding domain-containing protein [Thiomicrorhabdus sp. ZW0627]|uniref:cell division protein ZipA C-terminal FtsZ-binding domain-containing protein n=1 Tax=Thiomicrorhabdus sp. ZW0627 TaxID=3039774 RepID=UPI00243699F1|nr:cell division protein ZipA C-terminal FtsZ-binding domain-containing protein [Thiomicrorhabdus sp. ZW0627]MDG6772955.1 cell division protein ZipA C-terminal FtsZ-binding domain-containing protein [Thiomicrorhabdus sp. ZW0627]